MPINQNLYPYNAQVRKLPIHLTGIGGSEYQGRMCRPEGYFWHQILYSAQGDGYLKYDNATIHLSDEWYFFLPANYPHEYYPAQCCWDVRWIAFDGYACEQVLNELNLTRPVAVKLDNAANLEHLYNQIFVAQKTEKMYADFACSGLIYQYLLEFHQQVLNQHKSGGCGRSHMLMPVISYIDDHFRQDFSMTVLAEIAGVTPQHLCRIFRETMHMRPKEYLIHRRLKEALRLLKETDLPVTEVSEQSGFVGAGYFSTVFRRYENVSPAEYRRKHRSAARGLTYERKKDGH